MAAPRWRVLLGAEAERDISTILAWTTERFGEHQARIYKETLLAAIRALESGPAIVGAKMRDEIRPGLMSLHVARDRRRGRHIIMFRVSEASDVRTIEVVRLLHDAMELARHMTGASEPQR